MMAINVLSTAIFCLATSLLSFSRHVNALPQGVQNQQFEPITEVCLGCICESISTCNRSLTCEGDVCGMFGITWAYWADANKPVLQGDNPNDGQAYPRCANDPTCARQTVINYMSRFAQDCNHDGSIDCADYAAIHKLGGYGCSGYLDPNYKNKYDTCQKSVYDLSGSVPSENSDIKSGWDSVPIQNGNIQSGWDSVPIQNSNIQFQKQEQQPDAKSLKT